MEAIGSFQVVSRVIQIRHVRSQEKHWDWANKELILLKTVGFLDPVQQLSVLRTSNQQVWSMHLASCPRNVSTTNPRKVIL